MCADTCAYCGEFAAKCQGQCWVDILATGSIMPALVAFRLHGRSSRRETFLASGWARGGCEAEGWRSLAAAFGEVRQCGEQRR